MIIKQSAGGLKHFTFDQIQQLESEFILNYNISAECLMECAGFHASQWVSSQCQKQQIYIFCGRGNNGGDGFVLARHLWFLGFNVHLVLLSEVNEYSGLSKLQLSRCLSLSIPYWIYHQFDFTSISHDSVIVDAMIGIGLSKSLNHKYLDCIQQLNTIDCLRVSLDVATGMIDDYKTHDIFIPNIILTFGTLKQVFYHYLDYDYNVFLCLIGLDCYQDCLGQSVVEIGYD